MKREDVRRAKEAILKSDKILVVGHIHPDLDSLATELALYHGLRSLKKDVHAWSQTRPATHGRFLPSSEVVQVPPFPDDHFDLVITVDTPVLDRLGQDVLPRLKHAKELMNLDHHISNVRFGTINWVDETASSCGEIAYELFRELGVQIDQAMATCIYTSILTDTGSFHFGNTKPFTHEIAAHMLRLGVDPERISREVYRNMPLAKVRLFNLALKNLELAFGGKVSLLTLSASLYRQAGALREDAEGFIEYARSIRGVMIALLFDELEGGKAVKIGFRSNGTEYDVNELAKKFGGGGHKAASGAKIQGQLLGVKEKVLAEVGRMLGSSLNGVEKVLV